VILIPVTNPLERLLEQNDEWLLQHRYMQVEGMAELTPQLIDADPAQLLPMTA
jgi:hypothetical protein